MIQRNMSATISLPNRPRSHLKIKDVATFKGPISIRSILFLFFLFPIRSIYYCRTWVGLNRKMSGTTFITLLFFFVRPLFKSNDVYVILFAYQ